MIRVFISKHGAISASGLTPGEVLLIDDFEHDREIRITRCGGYQIRKEPLHEKEKS